MKLETLEKFREHKGTGEVWYEVSWLPYLDTDLCRAYRHRHNYAQGWDSDVFTIEAEASDRFEEVVASGQAECAQVTRRLYTIRQWSDGERERLTGVVV